MKRALLLCLPIVVMLACTGTGEFELAPLAADHPASSQAQESAPPVGAWLLPDSEGHATVQGAEPPGEAPAPPSSGVSGEGYTCPMHPEFRQAEPGRCPECGMQLVRAQVGQPAQEHGEPVEEAPGHEHGPEAEPEAESNPEPPDPVHAAEHEPAAVPESKPGSEADHEHDHEVEPEPEAGQEHAADEHEAEHEHAAQPEVAADVEPAIEHATDQTAGHHHADGDEPRHGIGRLVAWLGRFHPMIVHFPIALAFGAALAELLGLTSAARFCVLTAAVTAIAAAALGWAHAWSGDFPTDLIDAVERHRWFGTTTAGWLTATAMCSEVARRRPGRSGPLIYRILLYAGVVLVAATGHFGAIVTHGPGYAAW